MSDTSPRSLRLAVEEGLFWTGSLAAFGGQLAFLVKALSDPYPTFFLLLIGTAFLAIAIPFFWRMNTSPSSIAGGGNRRTWVYSISTRVTSLLFVLLAIMFTTIFAARNYRAIFSLAEVVVESDEAAVQQRNVAVVKLINENQDAPSLTTLDHIPGYPTNTPTSIAKFDFIKQSRYEYVKVESLVTEIVSYEPLPKGVRAISEQRTYTTSVDLREAVIEVKESSGVWKKRLEQKGNFLVIESKPVPFEVLVKISTPGIYSLRTYMMISNGTISERVELAEPKKMFFADVPMFDAAPPAFNEFDRVPAGVPPAPAPPAPKSTDP